jgi:hypothetical protein
MLPREIFENKTGEQQVATESEVFYLVEKIETENGIRAYLRGAEYYQKGQAPAETLFFLNIAKRITAEGLKYASKMPIVIGFMLGQLLLPKQYKLSIQGIIDTYNTIIWKVISPHILKKKNMIEMPRETRVFIYNFLKQLGIGENTCYQTSAIISHFFEYDNAYRYRVQDLLSETNKTEFMCSTQKVLKRFIKLSKERDEKGVSDKLVSGLKLISWVLIIPKYKKAFLNALRLSKFKNFQYDKIDIYWISMRNDYLYMGEDVETRSKRNKGKKIPIPMPQAEYEEYIKTLNQDNNEVLILRSIDVLLKNPKYLKIIKDKIK